jgi:hypothetical protein
LYRPDLKSTVETEEEISVLHVIACKGAVTVAFCLCLRLQLTGQLEKGIARAQSLLHT